MFNPIFYKTQTNGKYGFNTRNQQVLSGHFCLCVYLSAPGPFTPLRSLGQLHPAAGLLQNLSCYCPIFWLLRNGRKYEKNMEKLEFCYWVFSSTLIHQSHDTELAIGNSSIVIFKETNSKQCHLFRHFKQNTSRLFFSHHDNISKTSTGVAYFFTHLLNSVTRLIHQRNDLYASMFPFLQ